MLPSQTTPFCPELSLQIIQIPQQQQAQQAQQPQQAGQYQQYVSAGQQPTILQPGQIQVG
jgi:hypothetical protein